MGTSWGNCIIISQNNTNIGIYLFELIQNFLSFLIIHENIPHIHSFNNYADVLIASWIKDSFGFDYFKNHQMQQNFLT